MIKDRIFLVCTILFIAYCPNVLGTEVILLGKDPNLEKIFQQFFMSPIGGGIIPQKPNITESEFLDWLDNVKDKNIPPVIVIFLTQPQDITRMREIIQKYPKMLFLYEKPNENYPPNSGSIVGIGSWEKLWKGLWEGTVDENGDKIVTKNELLRYLGYNGPVLDDYPISFYSNIWSYRGLEFNVQFVFKVGDPYPFQVEGKSKNSNFIGRLEMTSTGLFLNINWERNYDIRFSYDPSQKIFNSEKIFDTESINLKQFQGSKMEIVEDAVENRIEISPSTTLVISTNRSVSFTVAPARYKNQISIIANTGEVSNLQYTSPSNECDATLKFYLKDKFFKNIKVRVISAEVSDPNARREQMKLIAEEEASLDAKIQIAEYIYGVSIQSSTQAKDFIAKKDDIVAKVSGYLMGVKVTNPIWISREKVEVTAIVDRVFLEKIVETAFHGNSELIKLIKSQLPPKLTRKGEAAIVYE